MPAPEQPRSSETAASSSKTEKTKALIPKLPNDVGARILAQIPIPHQSRLKRTCKKWNQFFSHRSMIPFRRLSLSPPSLSHLLCVFPHDPSLSSPLLFDPVSLSWSFLPPMPCSPHVYGLSNFASLSLGHSLFVIGGSAFDARSFPIDRPLCSSSAFRFDFVRFRWDRIADMLVPRGSFACCSVPGSGRIFVAGGGSRHTLFAAAGTRRE